MELKRFAGNPRPGPCFNPNPILSELGERALGGKKGCEEEGKGGEDVCRIVGLKAE